MSAARGRVSAAAIANSSESAVRHAEALVKLEIFVFQVVASLIQRGGIGLGAALEIMDAHDTAQVSQVSTCVF